MRATIIETGSASGRVLCCTVFRSGGKKLLSKGHQINAEDVRVLAEAGLEKVWVTELDAGEVGEDEAVFLVATEMGCGSYEIRLVAGGRANLTATENCCVVVDDHLLKQLNCAASVVAATAMNFSYAAAGQRIATVKSLPFAVSGEQLEAMAAMLKERGPILQARPVRNPTIGVLYCDPASGERARQLFEGVMHQRLERLGVAETFVLACVEDEIPVARSMQHMVKMKPTVVLVASTTAPAGPEDMVGRGMGRIGARIERFLAPVEPGNLLLLAYKDDVPIISAPGCFRSTKRNVVDLLLPPLLARYQVTAAEVACLGHGGLLS